MGGQDAARRYLVEQILVGGDDVDGIRINDNRFIEVTQDPLDDSRRLHVLPQARSHANGGVVVGVWGGSQVIGMLVKTQHGLWKGCLEDGLSSVGDMGRQQAGSTTQTGLGG